MARINLLPWRQEERLRKNKEFNVVLGAAAILAVLASLLTYAFFNSQLEAQQQANTMIETENARLDKVNEEIATLEQQRDEMLSRMKLIQDLQGKRSIPVRVWDDIARSIPSAMYLTKVTRVDDTITFEGFADNANVVSDLVRNLDASPWLADSRIPSIQSKIEAYQNPNATRPQGKDGQARQPYPEDNYIGFTVTTVVKSEEAKPADPNAPVDPNAPADPNAAPADPNAVAPVPTDPNAVAPAPADPNVPAQPVTDPNAPAQPAVEPAPAQPAVAPVPAPAEPAVAPVAPAPTDAAPQPAAQPQPAGGQ